MGRGLWIQEAKKNAILPIWAKHIFSTNLVELDIIGRMKNYIALVGDIVKSKENPNLIELTRKLEDTLDKLDFSNKRLASLYTPIGDEIQAVYEVGNEESNQTNSNIFIDAMEILVSIYPDRMRFSFGIGTFLTPINKSQTIGMNGPAFYRAREGVDMLKKNGRLFNVVMDPKDFEHQKLIQETLFYISHNLVGWNETRLKTMLMRLRGMKPKDIAETLGKSVKTIYKTSQAGDLETLEKIFKELNILIDTVVRNASAS